MEYEKSDKVKLLDGTLVSVLSTPNTFMANGSYEVVRWVDGNVGKPFWVNPEDIIHKVNPDLVDDINQYLEVIWDEDGLNLIPKGFSSIDIESDREDFNRIKFNFDDGRKHKTMNIHIGGVPMKDSEEITLRTKKEKKSKFKKIINVLKEKE